MCVYVCLLLSAKGPLPPPLLPSIVRDLSPPPLNSHTPETPACTRRVSCLPESERVAFCCFRIVFSSFAIDRSIWRKASPIAIACPTSPLATHSFPLPSFLLNRVAAASFASFSRGRISQFHVKIWMALARAHCFGESGGWNTP